MFMLLPDEIDEKLVRLVSGINPTPLLGRFRNFAVEGPLFERFGFYLQAQSQTRTRLSP